MACRTSSSTCACLCACACNWSSLWLGPACCMVTLHASAATEWDTLEAVDRMENSLPVMTAP